MSALNLATGGVPVALEASVTLTEGATASPDLTRLQVPFRAAFVIDEIRFIVRWNNLGTRNNLGGSIRAKFSAGRIDVSKDFVPIWNYGTQIQGGDLAGVFTPSNAVEANLSSVAGVSAGLANVYSNFRWKLPVPFLITPGSTLVPTFRRMVDGVGGSATVTVTYVGRRILNTAPLPEVIEVPTVAVYITDEAAAFSTSQELHLSNPFLVPIKVQRFVGRIQLRTVSPSIGEGIVTSALATPATAMGIKDSYGYDVVRLRVPVPTVFDLPRRAWTFNKILKPKERYTLQFVSDDFASFNFSLMASMIGHRQERLA